jgi:hypothetical protein
VSHVDQLSNPNAKAFNVPFFKRRRVAFIHILAYTGIDHIWSPGLAVRGAQQGRQRREVVNACPPSPRFGRPLSVLGILSWTRSLQLLAVRVLRESTPTYIGSLDARHFQLRRQQEWSAFSRHFDRDIDCLADRSHRGKKSGRRALKDARAYLAPTGREREADNNNQEAEGRASIHQ